MADSVQRLLEEMVPELEELQQKKIFTDAEIKSIVSRRTQFEYRLRRRPPLKDDFLKYIDYEMNLDKLRQMRKDRLDLKKATSSDFASTRRIHFIYERCLRAFSDDVDLWEKLIEHCIQSRSSKRLGKIFPRVLQHHPLKTRFWVLAARTEAGVNNNVHAGRMLLQRGLRSVAFVVFLAKKIHVASVYAYIFAYLLICDLIFVELHQLYL
jgi:U3 small nucleolar RNA-associated protein 6